jgi:hypothetical protein
MREWVIQTTGKKTVSGEWARRERTDAELQVPMHVKGRGTARELGVPYHERASRDHQQEPSHA